MKFHKYPQEEPEGNLYNKNNFLCKVLYSVKDEKERKVVHECELYSIGHWEDGHWNSYIAYRKKDDDGLLVECKSSDGLKSSRRLTKTVVRFVVCKF